MSYFYDKVASFLYSKTTAYEKDVAREHGSVNTYVHGMGRNNAFFSSVSIAYKKGVVGTGYNIQSKTKITFIQREKPTNLPDRLYKKESSGYEIDFDKAVEYYIRKWSRKNGGASSGRSNCELTGRFYFEKALRTMVDEYAVKSGGTLIRHHYSKNFEYGYKFELLPLSVIDTKKRDESKNIYNGFKLNSMGEITHIYLLEKNNGIKRSRAVKYSNLTLAVNQWTAPDQYSAITPLAPILEALEYIDSYKASEQKGAKKIADNPIFIKSPHIAAIIKAAKDKYSEKSKLSLEALQKVFNLVRLKDKEELPSFTYLSNDEEVAEIGKTRDSIYDEMYKNESRSASAGTGLTASSTVGEMSSSYNEALRGVQSEEQVFKILSQELIEDIVRDMIEVRLLNGLAVKGFIPKDYFTYPEKYREFVFMRAEKGHIDPVKTAKAKTENIHINGTLSMVKALAQDGIDIDEHMDDIRIYENRLLEEKIALKKKYEEAGIKYPDDAVMESTITDEDLKDEE